MSQFKFVTYDILSEKTHVYSTTTVSGGGTSPGGATTNPVTSTTTVHREQEIWARNVTTGKDVKLFLGKLKLEVLAGHRIIAAMTAAGEIVRVIVTNTGSVFSVNRVYNPRLVQVGEFVGLAIVSMLICLFPILGPLIVLGITFQGFVLGSIFSSDSGLWKIRLIIFAALVSYGLVVLGYVYSLKNRKIDLFSGWLTTHVSLGVILMVALVAYFFVLRAESVTNGVRIDEGVNALLRTGGGAP